VSVAVSPADSAGHLRWMGHVVVSAPDRMMSEGYLTAEARARVELDRQLAACGRPTVRSAGPNPLTIIQSLSRPNSHNFRTTPPRV
jgi:hypothetical protein